MGVGIHVLIYSILAVFVGVLYFLYRATSNELKEATAHNERLEATISRMKANIEILKSHEAAIKALQKEKVALLARIKGAKTDEEADSILSDIIRNNNSRVR